MTPREYILTLSCQDRLGIVAAVSGVLAENKLFILELSQFSDPSTGQFFMRIDFRILETSSCDEKKICSALSPIAKKFEMEFALHDKHYRPKVLLMVSKKGHCLNDLLHRFANQALPIEIPAVVSNHLDLKEMCSWHGIPFYHFPLGKEPKEKQEEKVLNLISKLNIDLIVLARYMQILSSKFCKKFPGKIINIHHSFLPSFKGAKPYHQAYHRGVKIIGATAHFVTPDLDEGPIIDQETVHVRHDHKIKKLIQMGEHLECLVLARALEYQTEQRVFLNADKTVVFN